MRTDLNLKGNELMAYALIYGFQNATGKPFDGSQDFISEWLGIKRQNVNKTLQNLVNKGYLEKISTKIGCSNAYKCRLGNSEPVSKDDRLVTPRVTKDDTNLSRNVTRPVTKDDTNLSRNVTQYKYNTINTDIHTDSGRTEFSKEFSRDLAFKALKAIAINKNDLFDIDLKTLTFSTITKLTDEKHEQSSQELVYAWNSRQAELKREGRTAQYMPNLKKWLKNEAVDTVNGYRLGKKYSIGRVIRTVNKIVEERNLA